MKATVKKLPVSQQNRAPGHLKAPTKQFYELVCRDFELEEHDLKILQLACEAWDRCRDAMDDIRKNGLTFENKYGERKPNPAVSIEQISRTHFARLMRQLNLSETPPDDRLPPLKYGGSN